MWLSKSTLKMTLWDLRWNYFFTIQWPSTLLIIITALNYSATLNTPPQGNAAVLKHPLFDHLKRERDRHLLLILFSLTLDLHFFIHISCSLWGNISQYSKLTGGRLPRFTFISNLTQLRKEGISTENSPWSDWPVAMAVRIVFIGDWHGRFQPAVGGTIHKQVGLGCLRKAGDHGREYALFYRSS